MNSIGFTSFPARRPSLARAATLLVLALGCAAALYGSLPGYLTYDSVVQLADGRAGEYHLWHPPVMAWLMGLGDALRPGTSLFVAGEIAVLFASLAAAVVARPKVSWLAVPVAALIAASPLVMVYQGEVWKDVLFADASVSGFLLMSAGARLDSCLMRSFLTRSGFVLLMVAALTRQNGALVLPAGAAALTVMSLRRGGREALGRGLARGAIALVITFGIVFAAQAWFTAHRADDAGSAEELRTIQLFDIVGALARDKTIDLKPFGADEPLIRGALKAFTPTRVDTIAELPGMDDVVSRPQPIPAVWRDVVLRHTRAYIAQRLDAFTWLFATPVLSRCVPAALGLDGPRDLLGQLKIAPRFDAHDTAMAAYAGRFYGTPVFSHPFYAALALALALIALLSRDPAEVPVGFMLVAMGAFVASFVLIGLACDYRYLYGLDLAVMAAALELAAGFGRSSQGRNLAAD